MCIILSQYKKGNLPKINKGFINYRSFKHFDQDKCLKDLNERNFSSKIEETDVNTAYDNFETIF